MTEPRCIEWVEFRLKPGVTETQFLEASKALRTGFLDRQPGFKHRTLIRVDSKGRYADLVHWSNAKAADAAMAASNSFPACVAYFEMLEVLQAPTLGTAIAGHSAAQQSHADDMSVAEIGGMEFAFFKPKPNVADHELSRAAQTMATGLYRGQPGFIDHFVVKSGAGVYADIVLADSRNRAAELCASWGSDPYAEPCREYLGMIDPASMQIAFYETLK